MAERLSFTFKKDTIRGYRWNATSSRKLLILHGFESSVVNFDRYIRPLVNRGYCVLAFDAPAHGRSTGRMINILVYKELINYINDHYGPVHHFIAHSMGGLALSVALEEWENNEDCKVVLIAPATETVTAADSLFSLLRLKAGVRKEFDDLIERQGRKPIGWFSVGRAAEHIRSRVLWMHDKDDTMTPITDVAPIIEKAYPNFTFHITEGLGHRRIYRDNKVTRMIIAFFDDEHN